MMKKFIILTLIYLLLGNAFVFSQELKLTTSKPVKIANRTLLLQSGSIGDKIYAVTTPSFRNEYSMLIYNSKTLELEKEVVFKERGGEKMGGIGNDFDYKTAYFLRDKILLFFETFEKSDKNLLLLCQEMDLQGNFVGDFVSIDNIQSVKKSNSGSFHIEMSEDSTKLLVIQNKYTL